MSIVVREKERERQLGRIIRVRRIEAKKNREKKREKKS
jgi:hypothetical protein